MKLLGLYFRSRLTIHAVVGLIVVVLLSWLAARWLLSIVELGDGFRDDYVLLYPVYVFAPLTAAGVLGASVHSPFGDMESVASYPLPLLRFSHLFGLFFLCAVGFAAVANNWDMQYPELMMLRNLAGISGMAFLTAWLLGSTLSWTLPFVFVILVQVSGTNLEGELNRWAWSLWPETDYVSALIAGTIFVAGLVAVCFFGERESILKGMDV